MSVARRLLLVLAAIFCTPGVLYAYGGPGSIVSGVGALLAALAAIAAAIFGFFWFPLKRLYQRLRKEEDEDEEVAKTP